MHEFKGLMVEWGKPRIDLRALNSKKGFKKEEAEYINLKPFARLIFLVRRD